jgi:hypothetical protein
MSKLELLSTGETPLGSSEIRHKQLSKNHNMISIEHPHKEEEDEKENAVL